jgi:hypothetical protein
MVKTLIEQLAELDAREAKVRANRKPAYREFAKMCLEQIARERAALKAQQVQETTAQ